MSFEELFTAGTLDAAISVKDAFMAIFISFALGLIISFTYMKTASKASYSQNFAVTLIMLPAIVAIIILLIGSNVARAFSLAGAFSIIRFRSAPGDPKDISYVLFSMAAGLACGVAFYMYAVLFTFMLCLLMFLLGITNFGAQRMPQMLLKIHIPEDLDYQGAFDDIFPKFAGTCNLDKVRTTDLGSLFELTYTITLNPNIDQKAFIDALRCRNGNLNITLCLAPQTGEY